MAVGAKQGIGLTHRVSRQSPADFVAELNRSMTQGRDAVSSVDGQMRRVENPPGPLKNASFATTCLLESRELRVRDATRLDSSNSPQG